MNKDNAKDYLPLVQALANGETIQYHQMSDGKWAEWNEIGFTEPPERYRIKPKPAEYWLIVDKGDGFVRCFDRTLQAAEARVDQFPYSKIIHVKEVV